MSQERVKWTMFEREQKRQLDDTATISLTNNSRAGGAAVRGSKDYMFGASAF